MVDLVENNLEPSAEGFFYGYQRTVILHIVFLNKLHPENRSKNNNQS